MGCGPSRQSNKHSGLGLSTDCSGSLCDKYIHDISEVSISTDRITAESMLMNMSTLTDYNKLLISFANLQQNNKDKTTYGTMYSAILQFINDNGVNISDAQVALLLSATNIPITNISSGSSNTVAGIGIDFAMIELLDIMAITTSTAVPANVTTWYNNYVEMLYQLLVHAPTYTPNDINTQVNTWIAANPMPTASGFTNFNSTKANDILPSIIKNARLNKQISGFSDYNGILSQTKLLPKNYHNF